MALTAENFVHREMESISNCSTPTVTPSPGNNHYFFNEEQAELGAIENQKHFFPSCAQQPKDQAQIPYLKFSSCPGENKEKLVNDKHYLENNFQPLQRSIQDYSYTQNNQHKMVSPQIPSASMKADYMNAGGKMHHYEKPSMPLLRPFGCNYFGKLFFAY